MKVAITCQNRKTVSAHAGKCCYFLLFDTEKDLTQAEQAIVLQAQQMFRHQKLSNEHPLIIADALITAGIGEGLHKQWQQLGKKVYVSHEPDPVIALQAALDVWQTQPIGLNNIE